MDGVIGLVNFTASTRSRPPRFVCQNPIADIREVYGCPANTASSGYAIYEPGFTVSEPHLHAFHAGMPTDLRFMF
jgi:hypothetical protein